MTGRDPKSIIDAGAMAVGQWLAVLVTLGLNAVDGFDVLSISFASPGIARDWGIDKATLGWVLSMELFGMALGSLLLGGVADKVRSEEHTSELQSQSNLVCRLLLEK